MNRQILISITLLLVQFLQLLKAENEEVEYYVNLINEARKNATTYEFPTSAEEYASHTTIPFYFGTFDFVIIGAGSAGTVIANRLSEEKKWNILLIEAGSFGNNFSDIPQMYFPIQFSDFNWGYKSVPQESACLGMVDRECPYPRGKGIGGTTLINGLVYARGHRSDFEKWAEIAGDTRWDYETVLKYFKKSENYVHRDPTAPVEPEYHGEGGYLRVEYHLPHSPQLDVFLAANRELGFEIVDYNANKIGASPAQINTIYGRRMDGGKAFILPVADRDNLKILTESYVTKITFNALKEASGVEFTHNGHKYFVRAVKEVVLSAGAIGSPQILMLSGIGPKSHLEAVGVNVVSDLEVGSALRDNICFYGLNFGTNYTEVPQPLEEYVEEYLHGVGPLASPGNNQGVGFYESSYSKGTGIPDIELMFIPANATSPYSQKAFRLTDATYEDLWEYINVTQSFVVYVVDLHAQSAGTVRLKSSNPFDYPLIDARFLSDPENRDINTLYEGVQLVLEMVKTRAFSEIDTRLQGGPLRACQQYQYLSKEYWYCALRQVTLNLYHPLGTCPIGKSPKEGAVVDSKLRVFGVRKLRVADASVIPLALAGHTNAPTVMVGEQLADILKETYAEWNCFWDQLFY